MRASGVALALGVALAVAVGVTASCSRPPPRDAEGNIVTVGSFRIRTFPRGAVVYVDGTRAADSTPTTLILEEGRHQIRIQHPGAREAYETEIRMVAGTARTLDTRIPPPDASSVSVDSDIEGSVVRINGFRRGLTPLERAPTVAGRVLVKVTAPDGREKRTSLKLGYGEDASVEIEFGAATSTPAAGRGQVTLIVEPEGSIESLDGRRLGSSPLRNYEVAAGSRRFVLRADEGALRREVQIFVEADRQLVYRYRLGPQDRVPKDR